ncbi:MAG: misacylated tRNA(Ala) deacylase [Chitinophagales bacterium]|jgi:misacylated tRNA(Ala) deacylase
MTDKIFYQDSYQKTHQSEIVAVLEGGIVMESTIFYPLGGGQLGDTGILMLNGDEYRVTDTFFVEDRVMIVHQMNDEDLSAFNVGDRVDMALDWERRLRHMRMHTSLHLMCHLITAQATGGSIGEAESRIDFDLQGQIVDKDNLTIEMNHLIKRKLPVTIGSITDEVLAQNPGLVRTMSVQPPKGQGSIRTVSILDTDYQPCGGTHVNNTAEIGEVIVTKIKNKGKQNKRISLALVNP